MIFIDSTKRTVRLEIGKPAPHRSSTVGLSRVHANDQHSDDDDFGGRNWSIMLVFFAAVTGICLGVGIGIGAGIPALWFLS